MYNVVYNNENIYFNYLSGDHISKSWKNNLFYENKLLEKIKSLNLNGLYIDIGSHHGNHSIYFDKFCNSTKVISIEGNPFNFNYLKMNITQNKCKNILYNIIVSDKEGETLTMKYNMINSGSSHVVDKKMESNNHNYVNNTTNTLDNLLKNEENISLMKLDIERWEYKALLGAQNIITKHKPVIVIELHTDDPHYNDIINFLNKNNYKTDGINYATSPTYIYVMDSAF